MGKSPDAFRTISEVAEWLGVQAHVLRFWESKFTQVKPVKRAGGRRYYRPSDMLLLGGIRKLLHDDGLTIKGVKKILREQGVQHVSSFSQPVESGSEADPVEGTIVQFKSQAAEASAKPAAEPDPAPVIQELALEPDSAAEKEDEPPVEATEDADTTKLPSFLHREPPAYVEDSGDAKSEPEPESARAKIVDAPDPPDEAEITVAPGLLHQLYQTNRLSPAQTKQIAPMVAELRGWLDRTTGAKVS